MTKSQKRTLNQSLIFLIILALMLTIALLIRRRMEQTDSDAAGFVIRRHLSGSIPPAQIKQAYAPSIAGKEKRKAHPSKEGLLGVEGIDPAELEAALRRAGVTIEGEETLRSTPWMSKARLFSDGLSGGNGSAQRRERLLAALDLPSYLSANRLIEVLNLTVSEEEYEALLKNI